MQHQHPGAADTPLHQKLCVPFARLQEANSSQATRLEDATSLLTDKERLEDTVKKQHDLIEQRGQEIRVAKAQIDAKDAALEKAR